MIICPNCKEEIEDSSHYCDQCGQALRYCNRCGRVGLGRRCTSCGGMMVSLEDMIKSISSSRSAIPSQISVVGSGVVNTNGNYNQISLRGANVVVSKSMQTLTLSNSTLGIVIEGQDGAVIGRRQGPFAQFFQNNMYVSGLHAQLRYKADSGWSIVDKHSSNGTKLNGHRMQPDVEMSLHDGDVVMIANVNLQVSVK
ncbi:MAG: FHA domain-containing protein [Prevotella sp.]|nr:FHA domain-containing protein [Prevotella sp.]